MEEFFSVAWQAAQSAGSPVVRSRSDYRMGYLNLLGELGLLRLFTKPERTPYAGSPVSSHAAAECAVMPLGSSRAAPGSNVIR